MAGESDYPLFEEPKRIEVLLKQHGNYSLGYDETVVSTGSVVSLATGEIKDPESRTRTGILNIYQDAVEMGQMQVIDHGGHDYITFKTEHGADFGTMPMTPMAVHARIQHQVKGGLMSLEDAGLFFSGMCCYLTAKANAAAHTSAYRAELIKLGMEPKIDTSDDAMDAHAYSQMAQACLRTKMFPDNPGANEHLHGEAAEQATYVNMIFGNPEDDTFERKGIDTGGISI
ncbi:MAG: hypothetical protein MRY32_10035 [Rickettsiales bacterium]|nr:hypothetical protein [Rickettsiales bacterium]